MSNKIKEGDWVRVDFSTADTIHRANVLYAPCGTGDSWHLKGSDGNLYYVQLFDKMTKL